MLISVKSWMIYIWHRNSTQLSLIAIFLLALVVRLINLPGIGLEYDELQSVTHSILSVQELIKSVQTFDPHPPLYYLQLHFWMLVSTNDWWIKLNSVVWSLMALVGLYFLCERLLNAKVAILGTLLFAVSPFSVSYAQIARMYSMLMFLGVGCCYFLSGYIERQNWRNFLGLMFFALAFLYSHGTGFLILVSLIAHAIWLLYESKYRSTQLLVKLSLVFLLLFILYIPWLQRAASISVGHTMKPTITDIVRTVFILLGGFSSSSIGLKWVVVILFGVGLITCFIGSKPSRPYIIAYGVVPIVFCILVSYCYRPIWLFRTIAYLAPFWMIIIACSLFFFIQEGQLPQFKPGLLRARFGGIILVLLLMGCATILQQTGNSRYLDIKEAAQFLYSEAQRNNIIYAPNERIYWGIGWYLIGPGSVNPLTTDYALKTPTEVHVYSKHSLPDPFSGITYWIVYRANDDTTPFDIETNSESRWEFNNLHIVRLRK